MRTHWEHNLIHLAGTDAYHSKRPFFSYWAGDASLRKAYRHAARKTVSHSVLFFLVSAFLPEEKRSALRALYAFRCMVVDIANKPSAYDRDRQLNEWRQIVETASALDGNLVAAAWTDTLLRYQIPRHYALQLIDGVSRDLKLSRYQTFEELATYSYGVASTVGLMSMYILGFKGREAIPHIIKLGVALQLTNILRNVGEDYHNGHIYLPREDLLTHGISETDIAAGKVTPRWRQLMQFQIDRARKLYTESWQGLSYLERDGQLAIGVEATFYRSLLDQIEKNDYDVFTQRASLSAWETLRFILSLWMKIKEF